VSGTLLDVRVAAVESPAPGVRTLRLVPLDGRALLPFAPGSHVEVECGGRRNAYSLTSDGRDPSHYAISVLRSPDGGVGSAWLHEEVGPGDALRIGAPRSAFPPPATARHHVLVGAGIGVTPFLSYARAFTRRRTGFVLHHVHRAGTPPHADVLALPDRHVRLHEGREAFLAELPRILDDAPIGTHLSVCGPAPMIDATLEAARAAGWPEHRLHAERFVGVEAPPGRPFTAHLVRTGGRVDVAADESLLDALERGGADVPSLCRQGVCGECRVGVRAGELEHHDLYLTEEERQAGTAIMPCVSRCSSDRLELDL
jgi:ferredoxin-NADP reductase